ncbi:DDE_Tnp_IS240 domain-containing protein [Bacillus sp. IT-79MI2]|nr:hypothetical protein BTH41_01102 [Bacillus mycoides]
MDETYIKVKGKWCYLYRAIDKEGQTLDVLLRKKRNTQAASIGDHGGSPVYTHADHWSQSYSHGNTDIKVKYFREKTLL